jgi:hypothetical protein
MPVDPRRAGGGSAEVRGAQRIADLERRLGQLERGSKGAVLATGIKEQTPAGGSQNLTATIVDVPNCTISVTSQVATLATVSFTGVATVNYSTTSQSVNVYLNVDGTDITRSFATLYAQHFSGTVTSIIQGSISQTWLVSLAAGTHTLKLRAQSLSATGPPTISGSSLTYIQTRA